MNRPPLPSFTEQTAIGKIRLAEDGWNSRDAAKVAQAYTIDTRWQHRAEFVKGREDAPVLLTRKWNGDLDYWLIKKLWAFTGNRIAAQYAYEYGNDSGPRSRAYGKSTWEYAENGLMRAYHASINEHPFSEGERQFRWPLGLRPDDDPGLSDFGF